MSWLLGNPQVHNTFASLGVQQGDTFIPSDDCEEILDDILKKLTDEEPNNRSFRRAVGFAQNIRRDLVPLLVNTKDAKIIGKTIKILVDLTVPVECLIDILDRHAFFELNRLLITGKEAFTDSKGIKAIVDHIKCFSDKDGMLSSDECSSVNNGILLLRNILHIPESTNSMHNRILWNLFTQSIDKVIVNLMAKDQKTCWSVTLVQLIALMYKDQHIGTLQKLLNVWFEASLSDSSEDNESNTSPQKLSASGDSSPVLTSSDSSDGGKPTPSSSTSNRAKDKSNASKAMKQQQQLQQIIPANVVVSSQSSNQGKRKEYPSSEVSDYGYGTGQAENQESISTSSNDDECQVHSKPKCSRFLNKSRPITSSHMKSDIRRNKLVKRSKTHIINMKGLLHHTPTDEDITNILKEFTVDFLLKGYKDLVYDLRFQLLYNDTQHMDTSHFFWLVTYFLKFAAQLELDLEHIQTVLHFDVISYLTFQAVFNYEEFGLNVLKPHMTGIQVDLKPSLRRMHLVVTAIKEILQTVNSYSRINHLGNEDKTNLEKIQKQICKTEDLKYLFVLLLRKYEPRYQSKEYLQDLIVTNHVLLLLLERNNTILMEYLKRYATVEMMHVYGLALQDFRNNGEFLNNCIFTMMHHIAGDVDGVSTLFQPNILKIFSEIWETDFEICDDWSDLIEYVIHKFINSPPQSPTTQNLISPMNKICEGIPQEIWTSEEKDHLEWYYIQSSKSTAKTDIVEEILLKYRENGIMNKTRTSVIALLLQRNLIDSKEYEDMMKKRQPSTGAASVSVSSSSSCTVEDGVKTLKENLVRENLGHLVLWLQNVLIEACYVKLTIHEHDDNYCNNNEVEVMQPVPYCYETLNLSIPVVPWTLEQDDILMHQTFVLLLHKLGFLLPADTGKMFVRIPNFWSVDYLFSVAQQLGPINIETLKFDIALLQKHIDDRETNKMECDTPDTPISHPLSITIPNNTSLHFAYPVPVISICNQQSITPSTEKITEMQTETVAEDFATISETDSVASDLTRMYVSDEEEKQINVIVN